MEEPELRERRQRVIERLERHFGSLEDALSLEFTGAYPAEWLKDFSEYHAVTFLLSDDE